jgi:hypothetical protein
MPQHRFRLFDDLSFLQPLDKPGILSRFLARHRSYFARQGLDFDALSNDGACARLLLDVFTRPERMVTCFVTCTWPTRTVTNESSKRLSAGDRPSVHPE